MGHEGEIATQLSGVWLGLVALLGVSAAVVRWPRLVLDAPRAWLLLAGGVAVLALAVLVDPIAGRLKLRFDASTEPLLLQRDPSRDLYRSAVRDFGDDEIFVVALDCGDVFTSECLGLLDRAGTGVARVSGVRTLQSLLDVTSFRWVPEEEWIEVRPFVEEVPSDEAALASLRRRALADPVYRKTLISEDGRAAALNVSFRDMSDEAFIASGLDERIVDVLHGLDAGESRFHVAGRPHVKARVYRGMLRDLSLLIPLSVAVMGAALLVVTGARRGVLLPLGGALLGLLWTAAAIALSGRPLTILTGLLGPTLLAIGGIYGVHVLARYQEEVTSLLAVGGRDGAGPPGGLARRAVEAALEHLRVPILIAGLTTVAGFAALLVSDVPAVFELGVFAMFGIAALTLCSLAVLPAALLRMPPRATPERQLDRRLEAALGALARAVAARPGWALGAGAAAVAAALVAIPRIEIDTDYLSYFDADDPVRVEFEAVNHLLAGAVPLYVVLDGPESGIFREPEVLRWIERLQARIDELPGVSRSLSFVDTLRMVNRAFHADDPHYERVPDSRPGVSELIFMIPKGDMQRFTTVDHRRANVVVRTGEVGSAAIRELTARLEAAVSEEAPPLGVEAHVTGNAILLSHSADGIARGQPLSVGLAALAIFVLVAVGLGSPGLGGVAMVPNVVPVLLFYGILGLGVAPLSLPTSLIGSVALGIAVDDTAHFLARYGQERRAGSGPELAVVRCARSVGRPIAITSGMLLLGFGVIVFSEFATLREFGLLSGLTMLLCLITDLVLLPALLVRARI